VIVCLIAWITYANRASIVNEVLGAFVEPFDVSVETIELWPPGEVHLTNLTLSPKGRGSKTHFTQIPEIHLTYDFQELRDHQRLKSVVIKGPTIKIDQPYIEALGTRNESVSTAAIDLADYDLFTESILISGGRLILDLSWSPRIETRFDLESDRLSFNPSGASETPILLRLDNLRINEQDSLGEVSALFHLSRDLNNFDITRLKLDNFASPITPEWFISGNSRALAPESEEKLNEPISRSDRVEILIRDFIIGNSTVSIEGFDGKFGLPSFPDIAFDTSFEGSNFRYAKGKWSSAGPIQLSLSNLSAGAGNDQLLAVGSLDLSASSLEELVYGHNVNSATFDGVDIFLSDASLQRFARNLSKKQRGNETRKIKRHWKLNALKVDNGSFLLQEANFGNSVAPRVEARFKANLSDLAWGEDGFSSDGTQSFEFENARIRAPGSDPSVAPLLSFSRGMLSGKWSEFDSEKTIQSITLSEPTIDLNDASLGDWLQPKTETTETGSVKRSVYKIVDLEVTGGKLIADSTFASGKVPKINSGFSIATKDEVDNPFSYIITLNDFNLRNHSHLLEFDPLSAAEGRLIRSPNPVDEEEVITIQEIEIHANAFEAQENQQLEKVKFSGALLRVGEGLKAITDTSTRSEQHPRERPDDVDETLSKWLLREVEVKQSQVIFDTLIPQVEGLQFSIETSLTDVPLSVDGILAQDNLQKVELAGIEIKDPYDSFITVAVLPTIFVEFSLSGLARQEIEKIDLVNPALHVGQGLFWWIDYQRNFRAQNEGVSVGLEKGGPMTAKPPLPVPGPKGTPVTQPDWLIKTINASAGKIVIAPTGLPIGMVPFPFNATTSMKDGSIDLKLAIPGGNYVYEFPKYEVNLYGLTGDVQFNVPMKQVDNNLVQTFTLRRAIWKNYEAEDLYLSVTFDSNGIYGSLGGEAYGGYVEGQFNYYLNDPGKWDGWLAGIDFNTGPLTDLIVPENFKMEGGVSLSLISEGRDKTLGKTTGEFSSTTPGFFDITKLDQLLDKLPDDWGILQRELTKLGLVALKRFDYEQGAGRLYLRGREGQLQLSFSGDDGTRGLNLHLYDERSTSARANGTGDEKTNSLRLPETPARPVEANRHE
tara:strand:- start:12109 stop:15438 length:3330 start_codon:yes stop_codon:yes gene_type:complete